ncbi:MAG: hypothetical protein KME06_17435 [Kastovskya adunca ATA6-11-RM4]|jgi:hypothetical protein|nr:hypothetical protein [Kastovskya adunca ATA6-11-RM4]
MSEEIQYIVPAPSPAVEIFAQHQLAYEFRREAQAREEFRSYCQWYDSTAKRHQQELEKMQSDINLFGWLTRRRGS